MLHFKWLKFVDGEINDAEQRSHQRAATETRRMVTMHLTADSSTVKQAFLLIISFYFNLPQSCCVINGVGTDTDDPYRLR